MNTPDAAIQTIRSLQQTASDMVKHYYQLAEDGSFVTEVMYLVLSKTQSVKLP